MSDVGVPCTLRLAKEVLEGLQLNARLLSFKTNKDLSYVDLIRHAIFENYGLGDKPDLGPSILVKDDGLNLVRRTREFWTREEITAFDASETGKMIQKCMDDREYTPFAALWIKLLNLWLEKKSVANHLLLRRTGSHKVFALNTVQRDVASVAHVVPRRGAIPEQIVEAEQLITPPFMIGTNCVIRDSESEAHVLLSMMSAALQSYQKELDSNVLAALSVASEGRGFEQIVTSVDNFQGDSFSAAFWMIAQHGLVPSHIVMHPKSYVCVATKLRDILDAPPLKVALETEEYGYISGIPVHVTMRQKTDEILVTAPAHQVGILWECTKPKLEVCSHPNKSQINFVQSGEVGITVINDYAISKIVREEVSFSKSAVDYCDSMKQCAA